MERFRPRLAATSTPGASTAGRQVGQREQQRHAIRPRQPGNLARQSGPGPVESRLTAAGFFGEKPNAQSPRYAGDVRPVLNLAELAESVRSAPRRSADDVSITLDGRRLDSKEKVLAFLAEVEADRIAGRPVVDQLL